MVTLASWSSRWTLARQFLITHLVTVVVAMVVLGWWVGQQIESGVVHRTAAVTALYVDSFVAPHLVELAQGGEVSAVHFGHLDALLRATPLGRRIVAFKVWSAQGQILFSTAPDLQGQAFPIGEGLRRALAGEIFSRISDLQESENIAEQARWDRLLETYAPVRIPGGEEVVAVSEFYQLPDELEAEVGTAQARSWLIVGGVGLILYVVLAGIVRRGSNTILQQSGELKARVQQLTELLTQNEALHQKVRKAAARTTALNERFLRRVSSDLHDGPAQDLGLALLRLDALARRCQICPLFNDPKRPAREDLGLIHNALESALHEVRGISAGLRLPGLEERSLPDLIRLAIWEHGQKTGDRVVVELTNLPEQVPLAVKVTIYRLLQEALSNAHRHAGGQGVIVRAQNMGTYLQVEVEDQGPGLDPLASDRPSDHLGLAVMRERVEMLGGVFSISSLPGRGTRLSIHVPVEENGRGGD
ncbi:MAG: sensor histidine kinase [Chloroflexi bacterium]|nr:sensor histidine kinase [Chloroflexota bacterium]